MQWPLIFIPIDMPSESDHLSRIPGSSVFRKRFTVELQEYMPPIEFGEYQLRLILFSQDEQPRGQGFYCGELERFSEVHGIGGHKKWQCPLLKPEM